MDYVFYNLKYQERITHLDVSGSPALSSRNTDR